MVTEVKTVASREEGEVLSEEAQRGCCSAGNVVYRDLGVVTWVSAYVKIHGAVQ